MKCPKRVREINSISIQDENYDFITHTIVASLEELYSEPCFSGYVKKEARPLKALQGDDSSLVEGQRYAFVFSILYTVHYTIISPDTRTVDWRDTALKAFHSEL